MFITLKSLLHTLLLPPGGPLLVAAAGAWLLRSRSAGSARAGWLLLGAGFASLWLLATPLVADARARAAGREPALDLTRASDAQAIVILGGGEERIAAPEYGGGPPPPAAVPAGVGPPAFPPHPPAPPGPRSRPPPEAPPPPAPAAPGLCHPRRPGH